MSKQVLSKTLQATFRKRVGKHFSVQLIRVLYAMANRQVIETAKVLKALGEPNLVMSPEPWVQEWIASNKDHRWPPMAKD